MARRHDGVLIGIYGASRSGKTTYAKSIIQHPKSDRVIAWDPKGEYAGLSTFEAVRGRDELFHRLKSKPRGPDRIAFRPTQGARDFGAWADMTRVWGMMAPLTTVGEELGAVTTTGKAQGAWFQLVSQGLGMGISILAIAQRPAEADKTTLENSTWVHICRSANPNQARYWERATGVSADQFPTQPFEFVQWSSAVGLICQGRVKHGGEWYAAPPGKRILRRTMNDKGQFSGLRY